MSWDKDTQILQRFGVSGWHVKEQKHKKQKTGNETSKALRYLQKQTFYYKLESILALVTKRLWKTSFIRKYSRTKTQKSKTVRKRRSWTLFSAGHTIVLFFNTCSVQITGFQKMQRDITVSNKTFRHFNQLFNGWNRFSDAALFFLYLLLWCHFNWTQNCSCFWKMSIRPRYGSVSVGLLENNQQLWSFLGLDL